MGSDGWYEMGEGRGLLTDMPKHLTPTTPFTHDSFQPARKMRSFLLMPSVSRIDESSSSRSIQYFKMLLGTSVEMNDPSSLDNIGKPSWYFRYRLIAASSGVKASIANG